MVAQAPPAPPFDGDPSRIRDICREVIEALSDKPRSELRRIPVMWLANAAHCSWRDEAFQAALTQLTTAPNHPLSLYFVWFDELQNRELSFEAQEVSEFLREHIMPHPITGEPIKHFENKLHPVYRITRVFESHLEGNR